MLCSRVVQAPIHAGACALIAAFVLFAAGSTWQACQGQSYGYPNFGFRSYANTSGRSYNSGLGGYSSNNSFDTGFSGMSQTSNGMTYSTQRSSQAARQLAQDVKSIWSALPVGRALNRPQQVMAPVSQSQPRQSAMAGPAPNMNGLLPPMSKPDMLRIFLEGGTPQSDQNYQSGSPVSQTASSAATGTAYNNYKTAENEATKARNAAQRVRYYDKDRWSRKNDASQAEYAANNANYAAQRAQSAAYNGDSQARGYANLARQAANRARQDANQARYNADTMP